ncbi:hypothetical protein Pla163_13810 [Planctomycetes bacterium Pla163]|uniref:Uncharacterized protein n=1 Tax=Rohdeia mirabilis TaxID=2528008 RepID=A0A518CYH7_9BACT|nr:hypothetical protein Pla163_13810 [Planctomycetes bacterium Pla163]
MSRTTATTSVHAPRTRDRSAGDRSRRAAAHRGPGPGRRALLRAGAGILGGALALFAASCVSSGPEPARPSHDVAPELKRLTWLVGTWRAGSAPADSGAPTQFEVWDVDANGFLVATNFQERGEVTTPNQDMVLHPVEGGLPILEVTGYDVRGARAIPLPRPSYTLVESTNEYARFEGAPGVVPRAILYQRVGRDRLTISMVLPNNSTESEYFVTFSRVE